MSSTSAMRRTAALLVAATLLVMVLLAFVAGRSSGPVANDPVVTDKLAGAALPVITSLLPLAWLVDEAGGDRVSASALLTAGDDPHGFAPRPGHVQRLASARLLVMVGGLDNWARRLLPDSETAPALLVLGELPGLPSPVGHADRQGLPRREGHTDRDPHLWLDPLLVRDHVLPALVDALGSLDPGGAAYYQARGQALAHELGQLDEQIRDTLNAAHCRYYLAWHDAWPWFAGRYDLEELGIVEHSPGAGASARQLAALVESARRHSVPAILVQPRAGRRNAVTLAKEFSATVVTADPLGDPRDPSRGDYFALMRTLAGAFASACGAQR
ncbi:MAG: zinc ABC transporter substrate-binding protein [Proteobacteria bacterium]|nr:zinc ABC transporter substrate-binding protein [Pseudomonadota bacterium]